MHDGRNYQGQKIEKSQRPGPTDDSGYHQKKQANIETAFGNK